MYLRYEDLVQSPQAVIETIQSFTDIDLSEFDTSMQNVRTAVRFDIKKEKKRPLHSKHYGKGISSARVGRFASVLDRKVVLDIERTCRLLFETFNYVPVADT